MKALTIRQPWASLVAVGVKTIETRGWSTKYRGELLIHAGKCEPELGMTVGAWTVCRGSSGWTMRDRPPGQAASEDAYVPLPLGAVVASCQLADCVPMVDVLTGEGPDDHDAHRRALYLMRGADPELAVVDRFADMNDPTREVDVSDQLPFGEFSPGRYAWLLEYIKPTTERCPRCWGGMICPGYHGTPDDPAPCWGHFPCPTCRDERWVAAKVCPPVPMRGRQGLWTPKPEDWS